MSRSVCVLGLLAQTACSPYFYDGEFATITINESTKIARHERDLGDCYRVASVLPTAYEISRTNYTLHIVHGRRYWPEFYLAAESKEGDPLEIIGPRITSVKAPWGSDHRDLEQATGRRLGHQTVRLNAVAQQTIQVAVLDPQWDVLGVEELGYEILDVSCFAWDSI